jgi:hypothetical protein
VSATLPTIVVNDEQLEPADLVAGHRWAGEGIVLPGEQVPAEHGELPSGRSRRDLRPTPGSDPLEEGAQRAT